MTSADTAASTPAGRWHERARSIDGAGAGFTAGIVKLLEVFDGSTLRVLEGAVIAPEMLELYVSLWTRGLDELRDRRMFKYHWRLLALLSLGRKWDAFYYLFPRPMQLVILRAVGSRSVGGRRLQVITDMHTGFNTAWISAQQAGMMRQTPQRQESRALKATTRAGEDDE